jgi:hypothetical protein
MAIAGAERAAGLVVARAADLRIAPSRILRGELDNELLKAGRGGVATGASSRGAVIFLGDEATVPAQNRVGRDEPGEFVQNAAAQDRPLIASRRR